MSNGLEPRIERIEATLDRLVEMQVSTQQQLAALANRQDQFQRQLEDTNEDVIAVLRMVQTLAEEGQRDREDIRTMQTEIRGLQLENRRILDALLNQRGEGEA